MDAVEGLGTTALAAVTAATLLVESDCSTGDEQKKKRRGATKKKRKSNFIHCNKLTFSEAKHPFCSTKFRDEFLATISSISTSDHVCQQWSRATLCQRRFSNTLCHPPLPFTFVHRHEYCLNTSRSCVYTELFKLAGNCQNSLLWTRLIWVDF